MILDASSASCGSSPETPNLLPQLGFTTSLAMRKSVPFEVSRSAICESARKIFVTSETPFAIVGIKDIAAITAGKPLLERALLFVGCSGFFELVALSGFF